MTTQTNLSFVQGDDKVIRVTVTDTAGGVIPLAGLQSARYRISKSMSATAPPKVSKTLGAGIVVVNAPAGIMEVTLNSADTAALKGEYFHELEVIDAAGKVVTVFQGTLTLGAGLIPNP